MAESFFATLKAELIYRRARPTRHQLEMEVFSYMKGFCNPRRRHSRLHNLSPAACEQLLKEHVTQRRVPRTSRAASKSSDRLLSLVHASKEGLRRGVDVVVLSGTPHR